MDALAVFAIVALGITVVALFNGIVSMAHGGPEDDRASYGLMLRRVGWQALAVGAVLLGLLAA
jgi:hypothetical protein